MRALFLSLALMLAAQPALAKIVLSDFSIKRGIGARPSVVFGVIENKGARDDALVSVASPAFGAIELHTHLHHGGVMRMRKIEQINLPAGAVVRLKSGGLHLMAFDAKDAPLKLHFRFKHAKPQMITIGE